MNIWTAIAAGVFSVLAIGGDGVPEAMAATLTNHPGTICHHTYEHDATAVAYSNGIYSLNPRLDEVTGVTCPLVRRTTRDQGAIVYVDFYHDGNVRSDCTLWSSKRGGAGGYVAYGAASGSGYKRITLKLKGSGKSDTWSDYNVECGIPNASRGELLGIDLEEY